jgi:phosphoribosylformimino-5-aminoimidazole carboxamide ribotide isomerase
MSVNARKPRLIPVLDVMGGAVVRAVGGRRDEYKPIRCPVSNSGRPYDVADGLTSLAGASEIYVADLDAITGSGRLSPAVNRLLRYGRRKCWIDAGTRSLETFSTLPSHAWVRPVIGSETCPGPDVVSEIVANSKTSKLAFSIDLRTGVLIGDWRAWRLANERDALGLARRVAELDVRTLIVLDIARVGTGSGTGTEALLGEIRAEYPTIELIAGGGVRTWADVDHLGEAGADAVLVASSLHDGTITFPRPAS